LHAWAWRNAAERGDDQAASELALEEERLDAERAKLAAHRKAGLRLLDRCRGEAGFADEASVIHEKLNTMHPEEK
jgi:hypothetical protein